MIGKLAKWITFHPKTVALVALLLLIPSIIGYACTFVNYDILSYLPDNLDSVKGEQILDQTFNDAASSFLIVENMPSKYTADLKQKILQIDGVNDVMWVDSLLDISVPVDSLPDAVKEIFYSKDQNATMLMIKYDESGASQKTMDAIHSIKKIMNEKCFISGMSVISTDTKDLADKEAPIYIALAIVLALITMTFSMESWLLPCVLLASLGIAIIYNMGTNIFMGQISYITQCIAAILQLGVTMDYSVFLIDRYNEEKEKSSDNREAMARAIEQSFVSLAGSSLTTIFGFLALCFMTFTLGLDIGIVMAKGVVFGVLVVTIVLPAFVLILDKPISKYHHKSLVPKFDKLNNFILNHKKIFITLFIVALIPAFICQSVVPVYYNLADSLPQDLDSIVSLNKLKEEFNMATTHFVVIDDSLPAGELSKMESEIKNIKGISSVLAYNDFIGIAIPDNIVPDSLKEIAKKDGYQLLMVNSKYNSATEKCNKQITELNNIVKKYDSNAMITGEGALSKDLVTVTDRDFTVTSIISIAAIFLLIAICFKSISIPTILILAIELAIMLNKSCALITGATIPFIAPTVIGCVQLGATVDYAILLTSRFREEIRNGHDKETAIRNATNAAGRSIFQSAAVFFVATFGVYMICDISIIKSICSLLARGAIISALVIIFMLAPILASSEKFIAKTTYGWREDKTFAFLKKKKANN
ncbi:MAG: MMPL family transporter [Clostridiales bacterium]|nr:MMPL family transporter [Clostridiales bacterium]